MNSEEYVSSLLLNALYDDRGVIYDSCHIECI